MDAVVAVLVNGREYSVDDAAYAVASGLHPSTKRNKERGGTWSSRNIVWPTRYHDSAFQTGLAEETSVRNGRSS